MSDRIIPRQAGRDLPRWQFPGFDKNQAQAETAPEPAAAPAAGKAPMPDPEPSIPMPRLPTLEEIEAIERAAREEGYAAGRAEGRAKGYAEGHAEGRDAGFVEGRAAGYADGSVAGRETGYAGGYESGHREGLAAGREEGREHGHREGLEAGAADIAGRRALLETAMNELAAPLAALDAALEQELLALVVALARQLIRRELKTAPGEIVATIRETMPLLPVTERQVLLYLHPEDAALIRELGTVAASWQIVEDGTLSRGGCRLESGHSRIDATVEARLNTAIVALLGGEREEDR